MCFLKELLVEPEYVQATSELRLRHGRLGTKSRAISLIFMSGARHPPCSSESLFPFPFAHGLV